MIKYRFSKDSECFEKPHEALIHSMQKNDNYSDCIIQSVNCETDEITIFYSYDIKYLMRKFMADLSLSMSMLWNMPDETKKYLETLAEEEKYSAIFEAFKVLRNSNFGSDYKDSTNKNAFLAINCIACLVSEINIKAEVYNCVISFTLVKEDQDKANKMVWEEFDNKVITFLD